MKTQDVILEAPRTSYEAYLRRMDNITAQFVGLSSFSKTIEVEHYDVRTSVMVRRKAKVFVKEYGDVA